MSIEDGSVAETSESEASTSDAAERIEQELRDAFGPDGAIEVGPERRLVRVAPVPGSEYLSLTVPAEPVVQAGIELSVNDYEFIPGWRAVYHRAEQTLRLSVRELVEGRTLLRSRLLRGGSERAAVLEADYRWPPGNRQLRVRVRTHVPAGAAVLLAGLAHIEDEGPPVRMSLGLRHGLTRAGSEPEFLPSLHWEVGGIPSSELANFVRELPEVARCLSFEVAYNTGVHLRPETLEEPQQTEARRRGPRHARTPVGGETLTLVHKTYPEEPYEYIAAAQETVYVPARFLCYYQVLEFYYDKCLVRELASKMRDAVLRPDLSSSAGFYVDRAMDLLTTLRGRRDEKKKLEGVMECFVDRDAVERFLQEEGNDHFRHNTALGNRVELGPIELSADKLHASLADRIYTTRCCVVHSNPEFEATRAVPLVPTPPNIAALRREIPLVEAVAYEIMIGAATGRLAR